MILEAANRSVQMSLQRRLVPTLLLSLATLVACGNAKTSSDTGVGAGPTESEEGTEIATHETGIARLNALLLGSAPDTTKPKALSPALEPLDVPATTPSLFLPAGCVTVQTTNGTEFHFAGCSGPGGLTNLNGTIRAQASASQAAAHAVAYSTTAFQMNGAVMDWESTVSSTTVAGTSAHFASDSKLSGTTAQGHSISRTGHSELDLDSGTACVLYDGSSDGTLASRHLHMDVAKYKKCGTGCPESGGEIRVRDVDSGGQTDLVFDGSNQAALTQSDGGVEKIPLTCAGAGAGEGAGKDAGAPGDAGNATCDADVRFGKTICHGTLDPTTLGAGIAPVLSNGAPGQHYYCYPADASAYNGKLLYHLVGTTDDPGVDNAWMRIACSLGFAAIGPMYENAAEVGNLCATQKTLAGQSSCILSGRRAIIYGETPQPTGIQVSPADSIVNRTHTLLAALAQHETRFPGWSELTARFDAKDFSTFFLSGHSQGSGHALMLARDYKAERLIMLGGVPDRVHLGTTPNPAPAWISNFAASGPKTPTTSYYGYNNEGDTVAVYSEVSSNYDDVGVSASACEFIGAAAPAYPPGCRRVHIPAGCTNGLNAHGSVTVASFGPTPQCSLGAPSHDNQATWTFLLTNP